MDVKPGADESMSMKPPPYYTLHEHPNGQKQGQICEQQPAASAPTYCPTTSAGPSTSHVSQNAPPPTSPTTIAVVGFSNTTETISFQKRQRGMSHESTRVMCNSCRQVVPTQVRHKPNDATCCWAACLFCCGFPLCAWIPYYTDCCQMAEHYCIQCGAYIGSSE